MVSTAYFLKNKKTNDNFQIAEMLLKDKEDLIYKAAGGCVREAGKRDRPRLLAFFEKHTAGMPRTMLRYALEHLDQKSKDYYMQKKA